MGSSIKQAPQDFHGNLQTLFDDWARHILLDPLIVEQFHNLLCEYFSEPDPLYLVRMVSGLERGKVLRNASGARFCPTDNSPAWWIHFQLFTKSIDFRNNFDAFINQVPFHIFRLGLPENINSAGWHVAHIFNAKDGDTDFHRWSRTSLERRMARNIHPCNYFYIPKRDWQSYGGNPTVVAFFCDQFQHRYRSIWKDFLRLVDADEMPVTGFEGDFQYDYERKSKQGCGKVTAEQQSSLCVVRYAYSRLCFKADVIERLELDEPFCIDTPEGTFRMTRREFYQTFPNVVKSESYQVRRIYHYLKTPKKALSFKL